MDCFEDIASGLQFPEGPIAMPDGSVLLVEIARGALSRVTPSGAVEVVADVGGGPNGAAIGPDGAVYICNCGGYLWETIDGSLIPHGRPSNYEGGRIDRVDLATGECSVLYTHCGDVPLNGPNDIVFDRSGGFYFTDFGKTHDRVHDQGAVYYARADGSMIKQVLFPLFSPNGVGLNAAEDRLYVAETFTCRLWGFDVIAPGEVRTTKSLIPQGLVAGMGEIQYFDSLALEADGNVCVATIFNSGITVLSPHGELVKHVPTDDPVTTNICFGGADLRTVYVTLSGSGRLARGTWERPGLPLNYLNTDGRDG